MLSAMCKYSKNTGAKLQRTWNQRMHAVHRDELLSQGIRNALVVNTRTRDPADRFASLRDASYCLGKSLTDDTPPVCTHANLKSRMGQDRWCPLDCMDLGHEGAVDNACFVEDLITAESQYGSSVGHRDTHPVQLG